MGIKPFVSTGNGYIVHDKRGMLCTDGFMDFLATIADWERSKSNSHMNRTIHKF